MKHFLCFLLLFSLSFSTLAFAHGGRTDSEGGHHDYNNVSGLGPYHYHHGEPAHLHPNGICPYDNSAPATTDTNGFSDSFYDYFEDDTAPEEASAPIAEESTPELPESTKENPFSAVSIGSFAVGVLFLCYFVKRLNRELHPPVASTPNEPPAQNTYIVQNVQNNIFVSSPAAAPLIPPQYVIGKNNLPADRNAPRHWGSTFTVYLNYKTHVYHRGRCRYVNPSTTFPTHILLASKYGHPCKICHPELPDMTWYLHYIEQNQNLLPEKKDTP